MILLAAWLASALAAIRFARYVARRPSWIASPYRLAVTAGVLLATTRVFGFRLGLVWLENYPDWRQLLGYGLVLYSSLLETAALASWRTNRDLWLMLTSLLVTATSFAVGAAWTMLVIRYARGPSGRSFSGRTRL